MHDTSISRAKTANWLEIHGRDCLLRVRVQPRASRERIEGIRNGRLLVRVSAPPLDGAANERLIRLLAHALGVPKSHVAVIRGMKNRDKDVRVTNAGVAAAQLTPKM